MYRNVDILQIDEYLTKILESSDEQIELCKNRVEILEKSLLNNSISENIRKKINEELSESKELLSNLQNNETLANYINESSELLNQYKQHLKTPMKVTFFGKATKNTTEVQEIIDKYILIAKKYKDISKFIQQDLEKDDTKKVKNMCKFCKEKKELEILDIKTFVCLSCGAQQEFFKNSTSYKDVTRVNLLGKYTYERRIHFRDCINQYQGKQNSTIPQKVYEDIMQRLISYNLVDIDETIPKNIRFTRVTKDHIQLFLKDTGHTNHYEDVFLIYHTVTGKKLDDISHLEQKLMDDFDTLSTLYDKMFKHNKKIDRKSFINTQYVLYQLLRRHKHQCKKEDFNILKTLDRKNFHDEVCKQLFEELGWNFTPSF